MTISQDRSKYLNMFVESFTAKLLQEKYQVTQLQTYASLCEHMKFPVHAKSWLLSIGRRTLTHRVASTNPKSKYYCQPEQFWAENDDCVIFAHDYWAPSSLTDLLQVNGLLTEEDIYNELYHQLSNIWLDVYNELMDHNPGWKKYLRNRTVGATYP